VLAQEARVFVTIRDVWLVFPPVSADSCINRAVVRVVVVVLVVVVVHLQFTFRAFGRCFYPKRLTKSTFVEGDCDISLCSIKIRIEQVSSIHNCKINRKSFIIAKLPA